MWLYITGQTICDVKPSILCLRLMSDSSFSFMRLFLEYPKMVSAGSGWWGWDYVQSQRHSHSQKQMCHHTFTAMIMICQTIILQGKKIFFDQVLNMFYISLFLYSYSKVSRFKTRVNEDLLTPAAGLKQTLEELQVFAFPQIPIQ